MEKSPEKSPHLPNPRLAVSLLPGEPEILKELRDALEKRLCKRLSWAEAVRIAIKQQLEAERAIADQASLSI